MLSVLGYMTASYYKDNVKQGFKTSLNDSVQHASIVRPARRLLGALTSSQVLEKAAPTA